MCGIHPATVAHLILGLEHGQLLRLTVGDIVRDLFVGGLALLNEHLEDLLRDCPQSTVGIEGILLNIFVVIFLLTVGGIFESEVFEGVLA